MVNLFKIIGYNLKYSGPNLITSTPYDINSSISQYEEVILEATVDKVSLPGPITVLVNLTLPNGNEYENIYMSGEIDQPNKYRLRLNDVIGNELTVGESTGISVQFKIRTETDVFITNEDIEFYLYKTNLDISYHPTDIDALFIGLNKLSMGLSNVDSTVQNYVDIANQYTDEKFSELDSKIENKVDSLNIYTKTEVNDKFQTKVDHAADITNLQSQNDLKYETKEDANSKLDEAKNYAQELINNITLGDGSVAENVILTKSKLYTDERISNLLDSAPQAFDTFKEIADYIAADKTQASDILSSLSTKANKDEVYTKTDADGRFVAKEAGKVLSTNDYTTAEKSKLSSLTNYDDTAIRERISTLENSDLVSHSEVYTKTETDSKYALKADLNTTNNKFSNYYNKTETGTLLNSKQERLVSGTNIKTINGVSILGSGNIVIEGGSGSADLTGYATEAYVQKKIEELTELDADTIQSIRELSEELSTNQEAVDALNSAISLKADKDNVYTKSETDSLLNTKAESNNVYTKIETSELLAAKQNLLVSGQTIKTVNGESILGEGNIDSINETRVNELINNAVDNIDLSLYYTKSESVDKFFEKSDIVNYATKSYVDDAFNNLLGNAPETLDTIQELAQAIQDNDIDIGALSTLTETKADKSNTYTKSEVDILIENVDVSEELSNYYTKAEVESYTDSKITNLINGAPEAYNTLKEISDYIESDKTGAANMLASINTNATDIDNLEARAATIEENLGNKILFKNWTV